MPDGLIEMIVHELADRRPRSDIVQAVCERSGIAWPEAEELVKQVEMDRAHSVAARQLPMLVFLSACTSAAGIVLVVYCLGLLLPLLHGDLVQIMLVLAEAVQGPLLLVFLGLSMVAGGVIGMHQTMLRYFET